MLVSVGVQWVSSCMALGILLGSMRPCAGAKMSMLAGRTATHRLHAVDDSVKTLFDV